jgi:ADP-ribose pyrophosphatase YjhB (NUDIX family)
METPTCIYVTDNVIIGHGEVVARINKQNKHPSWALPGGAVTFDKRVAIETALAMDKIYRLSTIKRRR